MSTSSTATTAAAPTGPQQCGQVTTVTSTLVPVRIISGDVNCAFAEGLLSTYYGEPAKMQGSGGFRDIGEWSCMTASFAAGGKTTCSTADGEISTTPSSGDLSTPESTPSTSVSSPTSGSECDQVDQETLDEFFPDGGYNEDDCGILNGDPVY